ncbi:hypothetical protein ES703_37518 [subsurface metagenome]
MTQDKKENYIAFRVTGDYFEKVNKLCDRLELSRSQTIRMMLDRGIEEFLDEKSSLSLVSNKQWNDLLTVRLEKFLENITRLTKQARRTGDVQGGEVIDITEADLEKWIDLCVKDDRSFETKDPDPGAEKVKVAILATIRRLKGRVD